MLKENYRKNILLLVIPLILFILPFLVRNPYYIHIFIIANFYAINSMGWNFISLIAGQTSLGQALFSGIAAYTSALLFKYYGFGPWISLPLTLLEAVALSFLLGLPALRVRGPYLLIITFAISQIAMMGLSRGGKITGGEEGLSGIPRIIYGAIPNYFISLILMLGISIILKKILDSKLGLGLKAIENDEIAAESLGVPIARSKLLAFMIAGLIGAISGWFYVHYQRSVDPQLLSIHQNFLMLMGTIIGGPRTIVGPIVGSWIIHITTEFLRPMGYYRFLIYGFIIMLIPIFLPGGIYSRLMKVSQFISKYLTFGTETVDNLFSEDD